MRGIGIEGNDSVPDTLLENAKTAFLHQHYKQLNNIQSKAIDPIYTGENALLISSTGSGKTEAACIPIVARISKQKSESLCVYVAPTKALLNDLKKRLEAPLHFLDIKLAIRHGDRPLPSSDQGLSFLLTTPESLDILLSKKYDNLDFSKAKFIICDEIHQIFGTPRGTQLVFLLQRLLQKTGGNQQRIALSATVGNPNTTADWFQGGSNPVKVFATGNKRPIDAEMHWLDSLSDLRKVIQKSEAKKILVFANSRRVCDDLFLELKDLGPYQVFVHYSTLEKQQRKHVESHFKSLEFAICVATTTLELGIDIGSIEAIILYEPPPTVGSFLQRIGRGSRRADKTWVIMTPKNGRDVLQFYALTSLASEGIMESSPSGQFFSVVAQQILSITASKSNYRVHLTEDIKNICNSFPWIQPEEIDAIMESLSNKEYLRFNSKFPGVVYEMGPKLQSLYNDPMTSSKIFSNISSGESGIQISHSGRLLASLPLSTAQIQIGAVILFAGRFWQIVSVREGHVSVRPTNPVSTPIRPKYGKGGINGLNSVLAHEIEKIVLAKAKLSDARLDKKTSDCLNSIQSIVHSKPLPKCIFVAMVDSKYIYYTFAGELENAIIQLLFSEVGFQCQLVIKAEGTTLSSNGPLTFDLIPDDEDQIRKTLHDHWRNFSRLVEKGPFYGLLPASLKKKEVLSQVDYGTVVSNVVALRNRPVVTIAKVLF